MKEKIDDPENKQLEDWLNGWLDDLKQEAKEKYAISEEIMSKVNEMDDYVIKHFRIAFGNRIVKHMRDFVPVYVACGGTELEGLDDAFSFFT